MMFLCGVQIIKHYTIDMEIPEYVFGIPTQKTKSKERVGLIRDYYAKLWKKLQKEGQSNSVFNRFLGVNVFIVEKERLIGHFAGCDMC